MLGPKLQFRPVIAFLHFLFPFFGRVRERILATPSGHLHPDGLIEI
ncbi:MAG: hypothetical protein OXF56_21075 [Rhodobacteraceae bacterium]|nr:hypothetical protein [Paracoccaceae bacterium]